MISLVGLSNPDQVFKVEIFQGMFLDARYDFEYSSKLQLVLISIHTGHLSCTAFS